MKPIPWQHRVVLSQRDSGWTWGAIRKYWLLLDDFEGHAFAVRLENIAYKQKQDKVGAIIAQLS